MVSLTCAGLAASRRKIESIFPIPFGTLVESPQKRRAHPPEGVKGGAFGLSDEDIVVFTKVELESAVHFCILFCIMR